MHVAIIMDGNRRWAKKHLLETALGHTNGEKTLVKVLRLCPKYGVTTLTAYALSGENLKKRNPEELDVIFKLIVSSAIKNQAELVENNIRFKVLGDVSTLNTDIQKSINELIEATKNGNKITLQLCLNYTGRGEIVHAVNKAMQNNESFITEQIIDKYIDSGPDPDLIIRPGGELRLSNFLTWQSVYSELYFSEVLWPDFDEAEFAKAINFYNERNRRFGK